MEQAEDRTTDAERALRVLQLEQRAREWHERAHQALGLEEECWGGMDACMRTADMRAAQAIEARRDGERGFNNLGVYGFNLTEEFGEAVQRDRQLRTIAQRLDRISEGERDDATLCSNIAILAQELQDRAIWVACSYRMVAAIQKRIQEGTSRPTDWEEQLRFVGCIDTQKTVLTDLVSLIQSIQQYLDEEKERKMTEMTELEELAIGNA